MGDNLEKHLQETSARLIENGRDLIKVTTHKGACPKCVPWQGKVLSITGQTPGYPTLQEATEAGLFHDGCAHAIGAYIDLDAEIARLEQKLGENNKTPLKKLKKALSNTDLIPSGNMPIKTPEFPPWYISVSFGKSTSSNYSKALYMAKKAPIYLEEENDGVTIHQAVYGKDPTEYLAFVQLYELVSNWKSAFVVINGEFVDRKIIGNINYCYGDKCRSGKNDFCYGASFWTKNPFGCHRAQIHAGSNPWYTFGAMDKSGVFHVDIDKIIQELKSRLEPYKHCPGLDMDDVLAKAASLPKTINPKKQPEWEYTTKYSAGGIRTQGVQPKGASIDGSTSYEIKVSLEDLLASKHDVKADKKANDKPKKGVDKVRKETSATNNNSCCLSGCLLPAAIVIFLIVVLSLI